MSRLSTKQVEQLLEWRREGWSLRSIADQLGCSPQAVSIHDHKARIKAIRAGEAPEAGAPARPCRRGVPPTAVPAAPAPAPEPMPALEPEVQSQPKAVPRVRTFEEQLAAVAAGARLIEKPVFTRRVTTQTLGGVASGLLG